MGWVGSVQIRVTPGSGLLGQVRSGQVRSEQVRIISRSTPVQLSSLYRARRKAECPALVRAGCQDNWCRLRDNTVSDDTTPPPRPSGVRAERPADAADSHDPVLRTLLTAATARQSRIEASEKPTASSTRNKWQQKHTLRENTNREVLTKL